MVHPFLIGKKKYARCQILSKNLKYMYDNLILELWTVTVHGKQVPYSRV